MKSKILLLIATAFICLTGCKKDKQLAPDQLTVIKTQIKGTWQLTDYQETYYDASGKVIKTESQDVDADSKYEFTDDTHFKRFYPSELVFNYSLTNTNGKVLMTIDDGGYEVTINNSVMTWYLEQSFQDRDYAKASVTVKFKKL